MSTLPAITDLQSFGINATELRSVAEDILAVRRTAEFSLSDPYAFHEYVVCDPEHRSYLRPFHKEGLEWINRRGGKRLKLVLWPRGHLKSTIFTQGEIIRRATLNPNVRALLNSSKADLGETFLASIKGTLQTDAYVRLYGNALPHTRSGAYFRNNQQELTFLTRTNLSLKEPTITVSGLDATKTSQHYDIIVHDDIVVRENVGNFEMMDKVWKVWQDSMDLLEPGGEMWVIGTRWHASDLYGRIITDYVDARCFDGTCTRHVPHCKCKFDVSILLLKDEHGCYIFDSKFDANIEEQLRHIKGRREFASQYENNPVSDDVVWFKREEIEAALVEPGVIDNLRSKLVWYMLVDPAESLEKRASYTAIVGVGVDHETGHWYVDYATQAKVDTAGFINLVFDAYYKIKPHKFGMEKKTRKALEYVLKDKMAQFGCFFTIEDLNPALGNQPNAKEIRIRSLRPLFESKRIHINHTLNDLISILQTIPSSYTWDLPDVLSYVEQLVPTGLGAKGRVNELPVHVLQNKGLQYAVRHNPIDPTCGRRATLVARGRGAGTQYPSPSRRLGIRPALRSFGRRKIR